MTSSPWRQLSDDTVAVDELTAAVSGIAGSIARAVAERGDEQQVSSVRVDVARELAAASARLRHAALALQVQAAHLVSAEQAYRYDACHTTRRWMSRHMGLSPRDAGTIARAVTTLERFPLVADAHLDGALTLGHVDAIAGIIPSRFSGDALARAIALVADIQQLLVDTAAGTTVEEFERFCARVRHRLDTDGAPDPASEPSRVWLTKLFNGRWALSGDLSADDGALLASLLSDHLSRTGARPPEASSADPQPEAEAEVEAEPLSHSERMAIGLGQLVFAGAAAGAPGRVGLFLHIDLDRLHAQPEPGMEDLLTDDRPHTEAGLDVSDDTLWSLLTGADVTPIFNRNGSPLSYGRTRRLAPAMLRRALAHRDRTCRVPGCNAPPNRHEIHHLVHWEEGGDTDPPNSMGGCRAHHRDHHARGLSITGSGNGTLTVTRPDGTRLTAEPLYLGKRAISGPSGGRG